MIRQSIHMRGDVSVGHENYKHDGDAQRPGEKFSYLNIEVGGVESSMVFSSAKKAREIREELDKVIKYLEEEE